MISSSLIDRFSTDNQPKRRGRPPSPSLAMARGDRIAWRGLVPTMRLLVDTVEDASAPLSLRLQAAYYLADRCLGKSTIRVEGSMDVRQLQITPADLIAEVRRLTSPIAIAQAVEEPATTEPE